MIEIQLIDDKDGSRMWMPCCPGQHFPISSIEIQIILPDEIRTSKISFTIEEEVLERMITFLQDDYLIRG